MSNLKNTLLFLVFSVLFILVLDNTKVEAACVCPSGWYKSGDMCYEDSSLMCPVTACENKPIPSGFPNPGDLDWRWDSDGGYCYLAELGQECTDETYQKWVSDDCCSTEEYLDCRKERNCSTFDACCGWETYCYGGAYGWCDTVYVCSCTKTVCDTKRICETKERCVANDQCYPVWVTEEVCKPEWYDIGYHDDMSEYSCALCTDVGRVCDPNLWGSGTCVDNTSPSDNCGPGTETQINDCGDPRTVDCSLGPCCNSSLWGDWSACTDGTQARTNDCGVSEERPCRVEGYIWDATDAQCTASKSDKLIEDAESIVPSVGGTSGVWDNNAWSNKNYEITGAYSENPQTLTADIDLDSGVFEYKLKCHQNSEVPGDSVLIDVNTETFHNLGFELITQGWFHAVGGGVFAGGSGVESVSVGLPATSGSFTNYLIDGPGSLFTTNLFSIKDIDDNDRIVDGEGETFDDNEYYFEDMGVDVDFWPTSFSFNPPQDAEDISNLNDLQADAVYSISASDLSNISGSYSVGDSTDGDNGIAIVYVDGDIEFDGEFTSDSINRILFIVRGNVVVSETIGSASPDANTDPHIEAGIIAEENIVFSSTGASDDSTIIVESPIIAQGSVDFNRDRGGNNIYPGEVVRFNPFYVSTLEDAPISLINILWLLEE